MDNLYKLSETDMVNVYADTFDGKRGHRVSIQIGPKMANGMWETLIHYKVYQDERCANKLAATIKTVGQIDLANYVWTPSPAFDETPTATEVYKKAF